MAAGDTTVGFTPGKDALFAEFIEPYEREDGVGIVRTPEEAETALRYLVKLDLVVVDGDTVSFHPRFADLLDATKPVAAAAPDLSTTSD